jgi:hypothetical protein
MPAIEERKRVLLSEEIYHEGGPVAAKPLRRVAGITVIKNPYAGGYVEDIVPFMKDLEALGLSLAKDVLKATGVSAAEIQGYGKGAIVGEAGELEHGALWHVPGGYAMREMLHDSKAIVPSTKKVGGVGARLDVPITHVNASYVRSHFDAMEVGVSDGPRADELAFVLVMTTGSRIHARVGGLAAEDVEGKDGLR